MKTENLLKQEDKKVNFRKEKWCRCFLREKKKKKKTYGVFYQSSQRQIVKQICEVLPDVGGSVLTKALIVEAIPSK